MNVDCEVLVVGAGPVGLTLAIELGQRGIRCMVVEKRTTHSILPKMERCHPRTMEHFRRLGIVDEVRAVGYPQDLPFDAFLVSTLAEPAIARLPRPSIDEARAASHARNDGTWPAEPYQVVSQYALEPLLREVAERTPGVTVRFDCPLLDLAEHGDHVVARLGDAAGGDREIRTLYLCGCDGGASTVRDLLGFRLEGNPQVRDLGQGHFRCDDLFDRIRMGKGVHYYRADDRWSFLIVQGDTRHLTLHAEVDDENELPRLFEDFAGMPVRYEALHLGKWTMRLMLSDRYATDRVFLAGDSAHLVTPIGGLGMNTGIGDGLDLAWKLAARIQGWGGPKLLASYEAERRPIGKRNVAASERAYYIRVAWRDACAEAVRSSANDAVSRARLGEFWRQEHDKGSSSLGGITQSYRYIGSPIVAYEADDDGADQASYTFVRTTRPGVHIPHLWLADGTAVQDHVGAGYTLVTCRPGMAGVDAMAAAFAALGAPFAVLDLSGQPEAPAIYERDALLLRPDLHIAWRGNALPEDAGGLARLVAGW